MYFLTREQEAISIHALCEEGDLWGTKRQATGDNFYPRPLRGGRRYPLLCNIPLSMISIHALCEEGDHTSESFQS